MEIAGFDLSSYKEGLVDTPDDHGHYPLYRAVSHQVTSAVESRSAIETGRPGSGENIVPPGTEQLVPSWEAIPVGTATEKDKALSVTPQKSHAVGTAIEHDTAGPVTPVKAKLSARAKGVASIEAKVKRAVTPRVISRVVQNRAVLAYQANSLLFFLDDVLEPVPGSNIGSPQLWEIDTEEDKDAELKELLRQLRHELRRFNDALESAELDKGILSPALSELQRVGLGFLKVTSGVVATGTGGLLVTAIGQILDSAGLVPWEEFIEFVKALRG
ncbi:MAG: hypothetical protein IH932_01340 [Thaumarchaeota archaeon]|nr:hypothetical protein [Nitrososphaerota archaeon]